MTTIKFLIEKNYPIGIPLTRGYYAWVDGKDYPELSQHKWHALVHKYEVYAARQIGRKGLYMHREILGLKDSRQWCDHKNRNTLDNRRKNLRQTTASGNNANKIAPRRYKTSQYKGVNRVVAPGLKSTRWSALLSSHGKTKRLGCFATEEEAARAYDAAAREAFGEFALTNF